MSLTRQEQVIRHPFNRLMDSIAKLSKTPFNYWAEFAVDIPLGVSLIVLGLYYSNGNPITVFLIILFGLFLFSFLEYSIHRWLFHGSIRIIVQGHQAHHENPLGYDALPFFVPALILLALAGVFVLFVPVSAALLLTGTIAFGYVTYGLSHYTIHHHRFHRILARNWAAKHHIHHHHPDTNFGVTTHLWDLLIGTGYVYDHKRI